MRPTQKRVAGRKQQSTQALFKGIGSKFKGDAGKRIAKLYQPQVVLHGTAATESDVTAVLALTREASATGRRHQCTGACHAEAFRP